MLMGILLHAGVMYLPMPYGQDPMAILDDPRDPYRDIDGYSATVQRIVFTIHFFRMPAFMLLAGFFGAMILKRRGEGHFLKNRFSRILAPLVLFWFLIWPLDNFGWNFGASMMLDESSEKSVLEHIKMAFSLDILPFLGHRQPHTMHLWFIYQLVYFYALTCVLHRVAETCFGDFFSKLHRSFLKLGSSTYRWVFLFFVMTLTWIILSMNSTFHFDVSFDWIPDFHIPLAYYQFFLVGWIVYFFPKIIEFAKRNAVVFSLFALILTTLQIVFVENTWPLEIAYHAEGIVSDQYHNLRNATLCIQSANVWIMALALVGLSEKLITKSSPILTFLVGASYWLYLIHRPLCVFFAALFQRWLAPGFLKYSLICLIVTTICLLTYQLFVRRSYIGILLNGKRY